MNLNFITRAFACAALLATTISCTESDDSTNSINPTLSAVTVNSETLAQTSAEVTFSFANSTQINFGVVKGTEEDFDATSVSFQVIEVETSSKTATATITGLSASTSYVVGAYAENSSSSSALMYVEFTTVANEENGGSDEPNTEEETTVNPTVSFALNTAGTAIIASVTNATELYYYIFEGSEAPAAGFSWLDADLYSSTSSATINIEHLTTGTWGIIGYAQYSDEETSTQTPGEEVTFTFNYVSSVDSYFEVVAVKAAPFMVSIEIDMYEDYCNAVSVEICSSSWWNGNSFLENATTNANLATLRADGTVTYDTDSNTDNDLLTPGKQYAVGAVALVNDSTYGGYATRGSVYYEVVTTADCEVGVADDVVTIVADETATTTGTLTATITRTDASTVAYIIGYAKTSEVTSDITSWINDTEWFDAGTYPVVLFGQSDIATATLTELSHSTEYEVFAMGISENGYLGQIASCVTSTESIAADDEMKYSVTVTPSMYSATVEIVFENNCSCVSYVNGQTSWGISSLESYLKYYENYGTYTVYSNGNSSATLTITGLTAGTSYTFVHRGLSTNGDYSEIESIEYTALTSIAYNSTATVSAELIEASANDSENAELTYAITYSDNVAKVIYGSIWATAYGLNESSSMADYGNALLKEGYKEQYAPYLTFTLLSSQYAGVIIPVDTNGNYGTPVVLELDDWSTIGL